MKALKLEPLIPLDGNIRESKFILKRQKQKLECTSQIFCHVTWTISDFANNLNLIAIGLDLCKVIISKVIFLRKTRCLCLMRGKRMDGRLR
jgi:hypothetical protein